MFPSPAGSSTPASAETIRREFGVRDLTKRRRGMSTGICRVPEEFADEDCVQGRSGRALVSKAAAIAASARPNTKRRAAESSLRGTRAPEEIFYEDERAR